MLCLLASKARNISRAALSAIQFISAIQSAQQLQQPFRALSSKQQQTSTDAALMHDRSHKGVKQEGRKWFLCTTFLGHSIAEYASSAAYLHPDEAAQVPDSWMTASDCEEVDSQHLKPPNDASHSAQTAAATPVSRPQHHQVPFNTRQHLPLRPVRAVAALVAERAEALAAGVKGLMGCSYAETHGHMTLCCAGSRADMEKYRLIGLSTPIEAAVIYDLVRINLYGIEYTVNFPPHIYTDSDVAVVRQDMKHRYPDMFAAAVKAAAKQPPYTYQLSMAATALDAEVQSAVAAAKQVGVKHGTQGFTAREYSFAVIVSQTVDYSKIQHYRRYTSAMKAAAAYDMKRQALGCPAVNFPASITAAGVQAAKAWLELNRMRITVQKQQWAAKAAALGSAQHAEGGNTPAHQDRLMLDQLAG